MTESHCIMLRPSFYNTLRRALAGFPPIHTNDILVMYQKFSDGLTLRITCARPENQKGAMLIAGLYDGNNLLLHTEPDTDICRRRHFRYNGRDYILNIIVSSEIDRSNKNGGCYLFRHCS